MIKIGYTIPCQIDFASEISKISFLFIEKVYQQVHMTYCT